MVDAQLDRVIGLIGAEALCADLDERGRSVIIGQATAILRRRRFHPVRTAGCAGGWG